MKKIKCKYYKNSINIKKIKNEIQVQKSNYYNVD